MKYTFGIKNGDEKQLFKIQLDERILLKSCLTIKKKQVPLSSTVKNPSITIAIFKNLLSFACVENHNNHEPQKTCRNNFFYTASKLKTRTNMSQRAKIGGTQRVREFKSKKRKRLFKKSVRCDRGNWILNSMFVNRWIFLRTVQF